MGEVYQYDDDYDMDDMADYYEDSDMFAEDETFTEMCEACVGPTLLNAVDQLAVLFMLSLVLRWLKMLHLKATYNHLLSFASGIAVLYWLLGLSVVYTMMFAALSYISIVVCKRNYFGGNTYWAVLGFFLFYLVTREYFEVIPEPWIKVRGIQMIMVMKIVSLCYNICSNDSSPSYTFTEVMGYLFCPGSVVFGPWIPFNSYLQIFEQRKASFMWVLKVFSTTLFAFLCLAFSSCGVHWILTGIAARWMLAIRDSLSVRFSHYFVAFTSEATSSLCGLYVNDKSGVEVTKPWRIELPRSLVEVVVYWNIPMHKWLKNHVFKPFSDLDPFWAVFTTFLVSSALHGMNFSLSAVLLSLGIYTYVEYTLREKLSAVFDACIKSRACSVCNHKYKSNNPYTVCSNLLFGIWTYFHLAYLGILLDNNPDDEKRTTLLGIVSDDLSKWHNLGYASHWMMLITYIGSSVI